MDEYLSRMIDFRKSDDIDDTPVLITRDTLKQILKVLFGKDVEIPFIEEGKTISGVISWHDNKLQIAYTDGTVDEVEHWDDIIIDK